MLDSGLLALHDLSTGLYLWAFSLRLYLLPACPLWIHPIHLLAIVTTFILYTSLSARGDYHLCKTSHSLRPTLPTVSLQVPVTLCAVARSTCLNLHLVPEGPLPYIHRTGSGRTDGRDVYGAIGCDPQTVVLGVGTQLPRRLVMTPRPISLAGGGCYFFPSMFVHVKVG